MDSLIQEPKNEAAKLRLINSSRGPKCLSLKGLRYTKREKGEGMCGYLGTVISSGHIVCIDGWCAPSKAMNKIDGI